MLASHGVAGATHRLIAAAADVPLGSLTYHFDSLDDLRAQAFTRLSERVTASYEAHFTDVSSPEDLVAALVDLVHGAVGADADEWAVTYELYLAALRDPALRTVTERWMRASRSVLERFVDPDTARALDALVEGLVMHRMLSTDPSPRTQTRTAVTRILAGAGTPSDAFRPSRSGDYSRQRTGRHDSHQDSPAVAYVQLFLVGVRLYRNRRGGSRNHAALHAAVGACPRLLPSVDTIEDHTRRRVTTPESRPLLAQHELPLATRATYVAFIGCGFAFASWASRLPQVRDRLQLTSQELGLVLLMLAAGSVVALLLAGMIVHRFGSRRTVAVMSVVLGAALAAVAFGYLVGVAPLVVGLFVYGFASATWDVAMNVQGAAVERRSGRAIMPRFHAGYSVGTVAGALVGAVMVALHVPVTAHLLSVGVLVAVVTPVTVRSFIPDVGPETVHVPEAHGSSTSGAASALRRWLEPRTLLVGLVVLAFAFAEGAGNDWISLSMIDGYQQPAVVGTLGFAVFLASMTVGRWFGDGILARYGRVAVVRAQGVLAIVGLLFFVFAHSLPLAFAGLLLWGVGASLGFPVGMSAAADDPAAAPGRVSVVASIGYCAFLGGPPLIGYLGQHITVLRALLAVVVVLALGTLITGALRPLAAPTAAQPEPVS